MTESNRKYRKHRVRLLRLVTLPIALIPFVTDTSVPVHPLTDLALESGGYVLLMLGVGLRLWATLYIGERKSREVVRLGPYSLCRHPLYLGTCLIVTGVALIFTNPLMLAVIVLAFLPATYVTLRMEEGNLAARFGDDYRRYCRDVPRLLPSPKHYRGLARLEISTRSVARWAIETSGILLVPIIEDIIQVLRANHCLPTLWTLKF